MTSLAVNIRCSTGEKHAVTLESSLSILQVKVKLVDVVSVPVVQQRLIYKGRVLKDDQTLTDYGTFVNKKESMLDVRRLDLLTVFQYTIITIII